MNLRNMLALVLSSLAFAAAAAPPEASHDFIGKPMGPIAIQHEILGEPALGRTLEIAVTVSSSQSLDDVSLSYGAAQGLAVNAPPGGVRVAHLEPGESYRTTLTVMPLVIDVLDLTIMVEADVDGMRAGQTALVAVRLAQDKSRVPVSLKPDADGGVVHAFRAVETTSRRLR